MFNEYVQVSCSSCKKQFEYYHDSLVIARGGVFCPYCGTLNDINDLETINEPIDVKPKKNYEFESRTFLENNNIQEINNEQANGKSFNYEEVDIEETDIEEVDIEEVDIEETDIEEVDIEEVDNNNLKKDTITNENETIDTKFIREEKNHIIVKQQSIALNPLERSNDILFIKDNEKPETISLETFKSSLNLGIPIKEKQEINNFNNCNKENEQNQSVILLTNESIVNRNLTIGELLDKIHKMCIDLYSLNENYSLVRHNKGFWYKILDIVNTEDNEKYVIYQELHGEYNLYIKHLEQFLIKTNINSSTIINQYYEFMTFSEITIEEKLDIEELKNNVLNEALMEEKYIEKNESDNITKYLVKDIESSKKILIIKDENEIINIVDENDETKNL